MCIYNLLFMIQTFGFPLKNPLGYLQVESIHALEANYTQFVGLCLVYRVF